MSTLSVWEAKAKKMYAGKYVDLSRKALCFRLLALIDLIRKKDEALSYFKGAYRCEIAIWKNGSLSVGQPNPKIFLDALALTEDLK